MIDDALKKEIQSDAYQAWSGIAPDFFSSLGEDESFASDAIEPTLWHMEQESSERVRDVMLRGHPDRAELIIIVQEEIRKFFPKERW